MLLYQTAQIFIGDGHSRHVSALSDRPTEPFSVRLQDMERDAVEGATVPQSFCGIVRVIGGGKDQKDLFLRIFRALECLADHGCSHDQRTGLCREPDRMQ